MRKLSILLVALLGCNSSGGGHVAFKEGTYTGESDYVDVSDSSLSATCKEFVEDLEDLGLTMFRISLFGGGVGEIHRLKGADLASAQDNGLLATYDAEGEQGSLTAEENISFAFDPLFPESTGCIGTRTNTITAVTEGTLEVNATIEAGCRSGRASFQCKYVETAILDERS